MTNGKTELRQLINEERDLPKVLGICMLLGAIAGTGEICAWRFHIHLTTVCIGFASFFAASHVKHAYLDKSEWRVPALIAGCLVLAATPIVGLIIKGSSDPASLDKHLAIGILWTGCIMSCLLCVQWSIAYRELGNAEADREELQRFLNAVGIRDGWTAGAGTAIKDHRHKTQNRIADLINQDLLSLRILVVNGYHDLVRKESPIRQAFLRHINADRSLGTVAAPEKKCDVRVLLLDPFSTFAKERAECLGEKEGETERLKKHFIGEYIAAKKELDRLGVPHRTYFSRPLFRMYIGQVADGDRWCIAQSYLKDRPSYGTPAFEYHYKDGAQNADDCFVTLAGQAFEYLWKGAYPDHSAAASDPVSAAFMAKMYGLHGRRSTDTRLPPEELQEKVLDFVEKSFADAQI